MSTVLMPVARRARTYLFKWETIRMLEHLALNAGVSKTAYLEDLIKREYESESK